MQKSRKYIIWLWVLLAGPVVGIFTIVLLVTMGVFGELPKVDELLNPRNSLATIVYSGDMKVVGKYYRENRVNVTFKQLDPDVISALIATEDARFYDHSGVDFKALARSASGVFTGGSKGGGSTISQQLAKMMFPREDLSKMELAVRKIKEWVIATRLEKLYTKEEILALYLNKFDFLNLAVGIKSASQIYFNRTQDSLKIEQAAMLVGMAKNPSLFNPIRHPDNTQHRRNVVLSQMLKYNYLTQKQFDSLKVLPLGLSFHPEDHNDGLATYFREYLRDNVLAAWCKKHINPETGKPYDIYNDGLKIYTTLDSRMQQYAEESVNEHMRELQKVFEKDLKNKKNSPFAWNVSKQEIEGIMNSSIKRSDRYRSLKKQGLSHDEIMDNFKKPVNMRVYSLRGDVDTLLTPYDSIKYYKRFLQTGFMAMEPQTGFVKAWVGGINHKHFKYDHVKVSKRQVGSTFKAFVYAIAIQEGLSPCYQLPCVRTCVTDGLGKEWCPDNAGGDEKFENKMITLKRALAFSINYVSAALIKRYGPQSVVNLVRRMGITAPLEAVPSICLGTPDISVFEMVGANSTFANKGTYIQPTFITRIEDKNGKVLEEFIPKSDEVFNEEKAYTMIQLMRGVCDYGTGASLRGGKYNLKNQIAGKTGTTQNNSDGWFIGLTPELVAGAWVGGEDRSIHFNTMEYGQGARMALPIWGKFFNKVYADKSLKISKGEFPRPKYLDPSLELDCSKADKEADIPMGEEEGGIFD